MIATIIIDILFNCKPLYIQTLAIEGKHVIIKITYNISNANSNSNSDELEDILVVRISDVVQL